MRVFRIENKDGLGVCSSGTGLCKTYHKACPHSGKCQGTDFGIRQREVAEKVVFFGWKFGFESVAQCLAWFPAKEGREAMAKRGARVVEYEAQETIHDSGNHQVIFDPSHAKKIGERKLESLS